MDEIPVYNIGVGVVNGPGDTYHLQLFESSKENAETLYRVFSKGTLKLGSTYGLRGSWFYLTFDCSPQGRKFKTKVYITEKSKNLMEWLAKGLVTDVIIYYIQNGDVIPVSLNQ